MRMATQIIASAILIAVAGGGWIAWKALPAADSRPQAGSGGPPAAAGRPGASGGPRRPAEVVLAQAKRDAITDLYEAVGTARANEAVTLTAKQTGFVAAIRFEEGELVKEGATLVELEARERKADLETARAQLDEVRNGLNRARQLRASGAVTAAKLDELEAQTRAAEARVNAAEARRDDVRIVAPFTGRVGMRQVSLGALVPPGTPITTLDDLSVIKVEFTVPQSLLDRLKPGLAVRARTSALKGREFVGTISVIDTRVDPATRSVRVMAKFDNRDEVLKPGLFLDVELEIGRRDNAILVPEEAIVAIGTRQYVFKLVDGRARQTEVAVGSRRPGAVEIVQGVAAGDSVVIRGIQKLRDGDPIQPAPPAPERNGMAPGKMSQT
jgi:membrane fusion protein (multidrug efflux system)